MAKDRANKRKVLLINPQFQLSFISYTCAVGVAVSAILFAANRYFFWKLEQRGLSIGLPPEHLFFKFIAEQRTLMDAIYGFTALAAFLLIVVFGLYFSHRIAGPIYNLRKNLSERNEGLPPRPIKFRKGDYFQELADTVNAFLEKSGK